MQIQQGASFDLAIFQRLAHIRIPIIGRNLRPAFEMILTTHPDNRPLLRTVQLVLSTSRLKRHLRAACLSIDQEMSRIRDQLPDIATVHIITVPTATPALHEGIE